MKKRKNGFTIIELLVVATIIALLSIIGIVSFSRANIRARDGKRKADLSQVRAALELYRSDFGYYPSGDFPTMKTTLSSGTTPYLNATNLTDPKPLPHPQYTYVPAAAPAKTYTLTATLENTSDPDCSSKFGGREDPTCAYILKNP